MPFSKPHNDGTGLGSLYIGLLFVILLVITLTNIDNAPVEQEQSPVVVNQELTSGTTFVSEGTTFTVIMNNDVGLMVEADMEPVLGDGKSFDRIERSAEINIYAGPDNTLTSSRCRFIYKICRGAEFSYETISFSYERGDSAYVVIDGVIHENNEFALEHIYGGDNYRARKEMAEFLLLHEPQFLKLVAGEFNIVDGVVNFQ